MTNAIKHLAVCISSSQTALETLELSDNEVDTEKTCSSAQQKDGRQGTAGLVALGGCLLSIIGGCLISGVAPQREADTFKRRWESV